MPTLHPQPGETVLGWNGTASQVLLSGGPATGGSIRFQGADADEAVVLTPFEPGLTLSVDLGRGDDTLDDWSLSAYPGTRFSGGPGHDDLTLNPYDDYGDGWAFDRVWVDLLEHRVDFEQRAGAPDITLAGFERVAAGGLVVNLQGDRNANELVSTGCRTTIAGAAGDDLLRAYGDDLLLRTAPRGRQGRTGPRPADRWGRQRPPPGRTRPRRGQRPPGHGHLPDRGAPQLRADLTG